MVCPLNHWNLVIISALRRVGNGGGKRQPVTPGHLLDESGQLGKTVRLT